MALQADSAGFLIGGKTINPSRLELAVLARLRDDVRAIRKLLEAKQRTAKSSKPVASDAPSEDAETRGGAVRTATPRLTAVRTLAKPVAPDRVKTSTAVTRPFSVNLPQPVVTLKPVKPVSPVVDRSMPVRDASGRFVAQASPVKPQRSAAARAEVPPGGRDDRGRFTKDGEEDGSGSKIGKLLGDIRDKIGAPDLSGSEDVDPNIKAAQEVAGLASGAFEGIKSLGGVLGAVATPLASGAMGMFKPKSKDAPTPWFRRFYAELRGLRREESVFNRAQLRTLKEIEAKPGEGKGGGIMGFLMMLIGPLIAAIGAAFTAGFALLTKLPGFGLLAKLAGSLMPSALMTPKPITQPTTLASAAGAVGSAKKPGVLARAGKGALGLIKRVPLLGAALAAVGMGAGVYESESDDTTTRAEKDKNTGKAIGGGGGAIAGMMSGGAAGAALGALAGPIGAAIGGVLGAVAGGFFGEKAGAILGEKVGGWVTDIRSADIPGMIGRAWISTTDAMTKGWSETTKWFQDKWETALSLFDGIWNKAKGVFDDLSLGVTNLLAKFGIDLPAIKQQMSALIEAAVKKAKDVAAAVGGAVGAAQDIVVQGATAAVDYGKEKAGQAGEALKNSAMGRGASAIVGVVESIGKTRVLQREDGSIERRKDGTAAWRNNNEGNLKFVHKGSADPADKSQRSRAKALSDAQRQYQGVIDLDQWGNAIFATPEDGRAAKEKLLRTTHANKTIEEMLPKYAVTDYSGPARHAAYAASLYKTAGDRGLDIKGKKIGDLSKPEFDALMDGMKKVEGFKVGKVDVSGVPTQASTNAAPTVPPTPATTAVVTAGVRALPQMPAVAAIPPKVPDFQPVTAGLASTMDTGQEKRPSVVVVGNKTPAGRDLSNRPLAHIVTGGLSGG